MENNTDHPSSNDASSFAAPSTEPPPSPSRRRLTPWAVGLATLLVVVNMGIAWSVLWQTNDFIARDLSTDPDSAVARALKRSENASLNESLLLSRIIEAEVHVRSISNKQAIVVVVISASFILFVIGFALFIMGAEGAFELMAGAPDLGTAGPSLVVRASAPGVLCFALAVVLAYVAVSRETSVQFGEFQLAGSQSSSETGQTPPPKNVPSPSPLRMTP